MNKKAVYLASEIADHGKDVVITATISAGSIAAIFSGLFDRDVDAIALMTGISGAIYTIARALWIFHNMHKPTLLESQMRLRDAIEENDRESERQERIIEKLVDHLARSSVRDRDKGGE